MVVKLQVYELLVFAIGCTKLGANKGVSTAQGGRGHVLTEIQWKPDMP